MLDSLRESGLSGREIYGIVRSGTTLDAEELEVLTLEATDLVEGSIGSILQNPEGVQVIDMALVFAHSILIEEARRGRPDIMQAEDARVAPFIKRSPQI